MKHLLYVFFIGTLSSHGQGLLDGFMKEKGDGVIALGLGYESTKTYLAGSGGELELPRSLGIINLYSNYGLSNKFNIITSIPNINGSFQDASIYLKYEAITYSLREVKSRLMLGIGYSFPVGNYETEIQQAIGQKAQTLGVKLIHQWMWQTYFLQIQSGYHFTKAPSVSSIPLVIKIGGSAGNWYGDIFLDHQSALGGKDYRGTGNLEANSLRELGVSYTKMGGTIYYALNQRWGISTNSAYIFSGRNIGIGYQIGLGVIYNFDR